MGMEEKALFKVDSAKCIGCAHCVSVCTGMVLRMKDGHPEMKPFERFGWSGCWRCQHCLAVCPTGAVSIFGKRPEDSLPKPSPQITEDMERLVAMRRSCRRFIGKNVDKAVIGRILAAMENAPTGGNAQNVEYTVVEDIDALDKIWSVAYTRMEENAARGIYSSGFSPSLYNTMKRSEADLRKDDMLFCGAPHLFVAHLKAVGRWKSDAIADCNIASAYFELLCNAFGLGTIMMSYSASVIQDVPEARQMLGIPEDHYMGIIIGFGYPEIPYQRGVQKDRKRKIHIIG